MDRVLDADAPLSVSSLADTIDSLHNQGPVAQRSQRLQTAIYCDGSEQNGLRLHPLHNVKSASGYVFCFDNTFSIRQEEFRPRSNLTNIFAMKAAAKVIRRRRATMMIRKDG